MEYNVLFKKILKHVELWNKAKLMMAGKRARLSIWRKL